MKLYITALPDGLKAWLDALSFGALLGTFADLLPIASSLLTFLWMAIRIYETETIQGLVKRKEAEDGH